MHRLRRQLANLLTGLRVVLTPAFIVLAWPADGGGVGAAVLFVVLAASDVYDGRLARRYDSVSRGGRTFDHVADIVFILGALSAYAMQGLVPWWVAASVGASFAFYVLDSWLLTAAAPTLIGSRVGHLAGICNYALVGLLAFNNTAGLHLLSAGFLRVLFCLVPVYSAAAILARVAGRRRAAISAVGAA